MTTSKHGHRCCRPTLAALLAFAACGTAGTAARAAGIPEPSTVFYGRITGTGSAHPFPITEGELRWTIRRADGTTLPLRARLWPLKDGEISYRLDVPQQALSLGLRTAVGTLPLKSAAENHLVSEILVNGVPASIAGSKDAVFDAAQALRGSTYRLDLEVPVQAPDSDGDGLPDWWEKQFGGDLDPGGDLDGDGWNNLREYLAGSDPKRDSRRPTLATRSILAVAGGTTGVALRAMDSDTEPDALVFTLTHPPSFGELRLRNGRTDPANPDVPLAAGSSFTQKDVQQGRLILVHSGDSGSGTSMGLSLHDGAEGKVPSQATVSVVFENPGAFASGVSAIAAVQESPDGGGAPSELRSPVVWNAVEETDGVRIAAPTAALTPSEYDGSYKARYGAERPQLILGGLGDDVLSGGMATDLIIGAGGDNSLSGGGGADRFIVAGGGPGVDTLNDFNRAEGDILDLDGALAGRTGRLQDFVKVTSDPAGARLIVDLDGPGTGAASRTIVFKGLSASELDPTELADQGTLKAGALALPTRLAIEVVRSGASENGPQYGEFRISRKGGIDSEQEVALEIRGSAANGVDYATIPSTVRFATGDKEVIVRVTPAADSESEPAESVEVSLATSNAYEITTPRASMFIADLVPVIRIEALEPFAIRQPASPAVLLISRDTVLDRSVLVRINLAGSAVNGTHYQAVSRFLNLAPNQATALLNILPTATEEAGSRAQSVMATVLPDATYLVDGAGQAEALLVSARTSFAAWRSRNFPGSTGPSSTFAAADPGATGVSNAQRYAFGMDPLNPERTRMPKAVVRDGHLTIDVWRRPEAEDVQFIPEVSSSLSGWRGGAEWVERIVVPEHAQNPEVMSFRVRHPLADAPQTFINLRVEIRP